jgi:hypothetical protein
MRLAHHQQIIIRESLGEHYRDEARAFILKTCATEANLRPDLDAGILNVEIHSLVTPKIIEF